MLHIIIPATPAVQLKPERYPLHPFWPPRLDREGGRGAWATHGSNKTSTASPRISDVKFTISFVSVLLIQVLRRWVSGDGGRYRMVLGATSHGPRLRWSLFDGRFVTH